MNAHVERGRQIADAIDSPDPEQTLYEQFNAEWKAWEAEDPTRTMRDFDREIGRSTDYTGKIVRGVTGPTRAPDWNSGSNKRDDVTRTTLAKADERTVEEIVAALPAKAVERIVEKGTERLVENARARHAEHQTEPTAGELMGDERFDPSEFWADTLIIRMHRNAREFESLLRRGGGLRLGTMPIEEAFAYLQDTERLVAEGRAAAQERAREAVA